MKKQTVLFAGLTILSAMLLQGCAPAAQEKAPSNYEIKFAPRLSDRELPWDKIEARKEKVFFANGTSVVLSGSRVMNTLENLMWLGDALQDPAIRRRGHDLVRSFYTNSDNATVADVKQNLYLQAALGEKKPILMKLLKSKLQGLKESPPALAKTVEENKRLAQLAPQTPLSGLATLIQVMLDNFVEGLQRNNASKDIWRALKDIIDQKYRAPLIELGNALAQISPEKSLTENSKYMLAIKALPLNAKTLSEVDKELSRAVDIDVRLQKLDSSDEGVKIIMDLWLILDAKGRQNSFYKMSSALYYLFNVYTDEEIRLMRDNSSWNPWKIAVRRSFQLLVKTYGVESIKNQLLPLLRKQVPARFEEKLKNEIMNLPELILQKIQGILVEKQKFVENLLVGTNYGDFFATKSVDWGKREIFAGKDKLIGLERDRYQVNVDDSGNVKFSPDPTVNRNATTSNVLGASLSMAGKRFQRVTEFEGTTYDSPVYYTMVLEVLNKIPALGGFKKIDDLVYPSFHVLKGSRDIFETPLDIKNQAGSPNFYVVPDFIALQPPFLMDRKRTLESGLNFSVRNQAELLRGMSHMIEFFRDWCVNGFDAKMARFRLGDLMPNEDLPPHLEKELLFPKTKLFEYSLGIASIVLENMKREGSGLVLFGSDGKLYYGEDSQGAKEAQSLMAAMVNVGLKDRDDTIRTADVAKFILAMSKFVSAVEGFENSKSETLNRVTDGEKKLFNQLKDSIKQLRMLMAMFSNFLIQKMQREDGTMDSFYSLKMGKVISNSRNLEDQVLAIEALLATGDTLGMGVYLGGAYDIYFGLNKVFFNDSQGFYSASDRAWRLPDSYQFTELMAALTQLSTKTDFSRGQIDRLIGQFRGQLAH